MLDYVCRYRKYYPADTRQQVWEEIPMEEGYAMIAGAMSMDGWLQFSGIQIDGYVESEVKRLLTKQNELLASHKP